MSDKSFGDHTNRNVVKNPLLSTAVTGLSLDELTHKAVLLPVTPSQGHFNTPDQTSVASTQHDSSTPSGDAFPPKNIITQKAPEHRPQKKSDDDFDVNEYIARLQGSRYVSAPINSHLKEDQNANLSAAEENLEEINLNETQTVEQQSLTADLAQNFSQLPTVLPHVASAVFSSFSNMLNLRRDTTPEEVRKKEVQSYSEERPKDVFQGYTPETAKEMAPPPKEPPVMSGPSNYRLSSKKKYAQIPGLTGGSQPMMFLNQETQNQGFNIPQNPYNPSLNIGPNEPHHGYSQNTQKPGQNISFFTPNEQTFDINRQSDLDRQSLTNINTPYCTPFGEPPKMSSQNEGININTQSVADNYTSIDKNLAMTSQSIGNINIFNPEMDNVANSTYASEENTNKIHAFDITKHEKPNLPETVDNIQKLTNFDVKEDTNNVRPYGFVISDHINLTAEDNRINIKGSTTDFQTNSPAVFRTHEIKNIESNVQESFKEYHPNAPETVKQDQPNSAIEAPPIIPPPPMFSSKNSAKSVLPPSVARRIASSQPSLQPTTMPTVSMANIFIPNMEALESERNTENQFTQPKTDQPPADITKASYFNPQDTVPQVYSPPQQVHSTEITPPQFHEQSSHGTHELKPQQPGIPLFFTPSENTQKISETKSEAAFGHISTIPPGSSTLPPFQPFGPQNSSTAQTFPPSNLQNTPNSSSAPSKPPIEPPRTSGTNFRMIKKRPQYYSGPIEGIGSISNNIKPIIPSDVSTNYQPAVFTPEISNKTEYKPILDDIPVPSQIFAQKDVIPINPQTSLPFTQTSMEHKEVFPPAFEFKDTTLNESVIKPPLSQTAIKQTDPLLFNKSILNPALNPPSYENKDPYPLNQGPLNRGNYTNEPPYNIQNYNQDYNTAFDLSRTTTESYEEPKEFKESSAFGLIGSLKSKLSSIDINKIQNTVTTFFDPAYNENKNKEPSTSENTSYAQEQNFNMYVPNVQHNDQYQQNYLYNFVPNYAENIPSNFTSVDYNAPITKPDVNYSQSVESYSYQQITTDNTMNRINAVNIHNINTGNTEIQSQINTTVSNTEYSQNIQSNISTQLPKPDVINLDSSSDSTKDNDNMTQSSSFFNVNPTLNIEPASFFNYPQEENKNKDAVTPDIVEDTLKPGQNQTNAFFDKTINNEQSVNINQTKSNTIFGSTASNEQSMNTRDFDKVVGNEQSVKEGQTSETFFDHPIATELSTKTDIHTTFYGFDSQSNRPTESYFNVPIGGSTFFDMALAKRENPNEAKPQTVEITEKLSSLNLRGSIISQEDTNIKPKHVETYDSKAEVTGVPSIKNENEITTQVDTQIGNSSFVGVSTVPLFGLSAIIADKSKENDSEPPKLSKLDPSVDNDQIKAAHYFETSLENKVIPKSIADVKNVLLIEPPQDNMSTMLKRNLLQTIDTEIQEPPYDNTTFFESNTSQVDLELSICETCREVNSPDTKETEDLTSQLIENITSPIQLSNPVEVPLTENQKDCPMSKKDREQLTEITHITEDTIEALQVQSATELLDDTPNLNYGWTTNYQAQDVFKNSYNDPSFNESEATFKHAYNDGKNYSFINPLLYDNSLFFHNSMTNASDEIKAEHLTQEVPRQLPIPTAPPEEKLEETGLDVNSIEQDAKKDFPIDEYVIEPSETDDDKIDSRERNKTPDKDTFTGRVERFQKASDFHDPPISMASYFDTGNYAVETHYRNSLTSPVGLMRIPPGFEDEYRRRLSGFSNNSASEPFIPNCGTQTRPSDTITYSNLDDSQAEVKVPNCSTQTKPTDTSTYASEENQEPYIPDCGTNTRPISTPTVTVASPKYDELQYFTVSTKNEPLSGNLLLSNTFELNSGSANTQDSIIENIPQSNVFGLISGKRSEENVKIHQTIPQTSSFEETSKTKAQFVSASPIMPQANTFEGTFSMPTQEASVPPTQASLFDYKNPVNLPGSSKSQNTSQISSFEVKSGITQESAVSENQPKFFEIKSPMDIPSTFNLTSNLGQANTPTDQNKPETIVKKVPEPPKPETVPLQDPINFFGSTANDSSSQIADFNRLASYFTTPAKPEHSKSFFELSQSQNHYRHSSNSGPNLQNLDQNSKHNIANLMKDLTSTHNIEKITTSEAVNYFTVQLEKPSTLTGFVDNLKHSNKPIEVFACSDNDIQKSELKTPKSTKLDTNPTTIEEIIESLNNCHICDTTTKDYKVRKYADETEPKKEANNIENKQTDEHKQSMPIDFVTKTMDEVPDEVTVHQETRSSEYVPVKHHWFYRVDVEEKSVWRGFSMADSKALEEAFNSPDLNEQTLVPTDGGRYDVNVDGRLRIAVYWKEKPTNVRRCSWFYKGTTDARYVPYTEAVAEKLEEEYRHGIMTGDWHRRLLLPNNEVVIMHGPSVMVHFLQGATDAFSTPAIFGKRVYRNPPKVRVADDLRPTMDHVVLFVHGAGERKRDATSRPRVVRRGHDESEIEDTTPYSIDHLMLLCHGVGSACDMRFRSVEEVVEDFRATSLQLVQSHYKNSYDNGIVSRVEVLPISWHAQLHSGESGVDRRLSKITLDSIPRLRAFTNHTVLDVLFYTSPVYHQTIIDTVCDELNRIYNLFKKRNPNFKGGVSLGGHSLGSVILYDLLCNQTAEETEKCPSEKTYLPGIVPSQNIQYPTLGFNPDALYALGSPIAIFECIRGVDSLGLNFKFPTCKNFFNIFHPYDPIAYRIEPLINPQLQDTKPFLIPHHKGRKRMHLELKDTMARVGADIKQKLLESLRTTWNKWKSTPPTDGQLEKVVEEEMEKERLCEEVKEETEQDIDVANPEMLGRLNDGRRIDYVLQEAPLEMINEYLFAMSSHVGYWESEDTMLLMLREIYSSLGVQPDSTVPQQSMTVHRTRVNNVDEATIVNEKENPSTSRSGT